jgi:hypothetical protein
MTGQYILSDYLTRATHASRMRQVGRADNIQKVKK